MLNFLNFHLEQIAFLVLIHSILSDKEISNNLQNMWLEKRYKHKDTIFVVKYSHHFIKVSITHIDCCFLCINCNSIKSTFINCKLELFILICLKISYITYFINEWKTFWFVLFHLLDNRLLIINRSYIQI